MVNTYLAFSIHPPDSSQVIQGVEPSYYGAGAPSRPPSRTNNRSPLSKLVAYTADHSTGEYLGILLFFAEEPLTPS